MDEFSRRRLTHEFSKLAEARRRAAERLGLPIEIAELLDALSLVVAEDPDCAGDYLQRNRGALCNVDWFLSLYDDAAALNPELLTERHVPPNA